MHTPTETASKERFSTINLTDWVLSTRSTLTLRFSSVQHLHSMTYSVGNNLTDLSFTNFIAVVGLVH